MITLKALNAYIETISAELEAEQASIATAVAAKAIGDGGTYWQKGYRLRERLHVAVAMRDAIAEAVV